MTRFAIIIRAMRKKKKKENSNNVKVSPIDSMGGPLAAA